MVLVHLEFYVLEFLEKEFMMWTLRLEFEMLQEVLEIRTPLLNELVLLYLLV